MLTRLTVGGAIYIAAICVVPAVIAQSFRVPFQFGGTSLMIVVGVALETVNQIEAHLITRSYEGLTGPRMTRLSGQEAGVRIVLLGPPASGKGTQAERAARAARRSARSRPATCCARRARRARRSGSEADALHERGQARPGRGRDRPRRGAAQASPTPRRVSFWTDFRGRCPRPRPWAPCSKRLGTPLDRGGPDRRSPGAPGRASHPPPHGQTDWTDLSPQV